MDVPTIAMDKDEALKKLDAYRRQLRRRVDAEYEAAVAGYEALAVGTPLVNLSEAFAHAGLGDDGRPRLAIARADRNQVMVSVRRGFLEFNALKNPYKLRYDGTLIIHVSFDNLINAGLFQNFVDAMQDLSTKRGYAIVPMVPADVRPKGNLRDYFILWEVEQWSDRPLTAQPDFDPFLLKHIHGDLYAVVAEWDLTELERVIMTGRREEST